ncbi:MAG: Leucine-tRNA ligase [Candidatus Daviesbacteria bacterium GW2011_GWA1_41_61]|uniref:Leucine--tRNA ligase n=1 Tax=Candidatus Daviesbacteria bacterium GW2011_GWA2_40_9 TaxID=1618424 RepID=A0A0G0U8P3_9BACT|nr:MAG: Leucine-tRNA ligase [Candidatus Daviesbacteria bacterium GW2011_GWC1_40_9]KKR83601.1 MAG: Leucine-tRNA ligase [Candidatus Daviesbacteria bacterium GW2011_GWA2_40_9]KKR92743.1 MAG: Leucine-tRNA ligase [Candidatus Daviesbacteria bacterium GW2011_GWB1_41_15]KKS14503.1 MAG: Leucine-tRNA ligase [Candidatus Daviesbacteria bacterium GW2011_GWA1_41_61]
MKRYFPKEIELKWQQKWQESNLYQAPDSSPKPKKYILDMFPYPSGDGLHVGHFKVYTSSDILARYYRIKGYNVLHPMGWDAFGLPAENYAIKTGIHPAITTAKNIAHIKKQMQQTGLSYDWSREINTTDPNYYKWTQWIFLKLFEKGLAYEAEAPINWCPSCKTGLANEEVVNGKCERCGTPVEKKLVRQWILRITYYADKLLEGVQNLDWPRFIKDMQINWIGRKEGINITYKVQGSDQEVVCFTTRPDTNFGATFIVIGPEHPLINKITKKEHLDEVKKYVSQTINRSEEERIAQGRAKTGVFTGSYAINNLNGKRLPIWVSDFVLGNVGTGAVVGVPGHDIRDFEFAKEFSLPIIRVVVGKDKDTSEITTAAQVQEKEGVITNSEFLDGLDIHEASTVIMDHLEKRGWGVRVVEYHLRDWIFSRQRYWGEPIPLIHCPNCGIVPIPENQLPLKLPEVKEYEPTGTGESPLAQVTDWVNTTCPKCGGPARRETNTMPQWAGSCWYFLRFIDPHNQEKLVSSEVERYWMPVDWYIGGAEHAVLHLLYSRFWHKVLYEIGVVSTPEPFQKLSSVGLVLAADGRKMSKSLGNVVTPDQIINKYGADTLRVYEGFMGPFENTISWDPTSINGVYKFLTRIWEVMSSEYIDSLANSKIEVVLNKLIVKIGNDIENMKFNTAIASMMEFTNLVYHEKLTLDQKKRFLIVLSPFAPHMTEELWQMLGQPYSIHQQAWPEVEDKYLQEEQIMVVIQVNGKVRDQLLIDREMIQDKELILSQAQKSPKIQKFLDGKEVKNSVYVPGKVLNFVT